MSQFDIMSSLVGFSAGLLVGMVGWNYLLEPHYKSLENYNKALLERLKKFEKRS